MIDTITSLIDSPDTFEVVRDRIADIIKLNEVRQRELATAAALDPDEWGLRVFAERTNPWEQFLDAPPASQWPIVNVWFDQATIPLGQGNTVERQKLEARYNLDCYATGTSADLLGGHRPGDQQAALEAQRAVRLVRNIIMAGTNTYLQLRGLVWRRWVESITSFQPAEAARPVRHVVAARLALRVDFNEFSPQVEGQPLEAVSAEVFRAQTGELIAEAEYQYGD